MTIGIGAFGPNAGMAVYLALRAAERVGTGSIGGFATFAALDAEGRLYRVETQRGGTATLFTHGETTGGPPPPAIASAPFAGVMSSGPDRPSPLAQFVAAADGVGLVTGHRLPNTPGPDGRPVNIAVLEAMRVGKTAPEALDMVLGALPEVDAGMIALGSSRGLAARNSALVAVRSDLGHARREALGGIAGVEVLHNAILPSATLAPLVADIALDAMVPSRTVTGEIVVRAGCPVRMAPENRVFVDEALVAQRIETRLAPASPVPSNCAAIYLGSEVVSPQGSLGWTLTEPNVVVTDGAVTTLSGQTEFRIPFAAPDAGA